MDGMRISAHAKVNLSLDVLGRRPDGFHEVRTVMQSISLADELWLEPAGELVLECDDPALVGEHNLVLRAAGALVAWERRRRRPLAAGGEDVRYGARIVLSKRIPAASGLGGASADAAAALVGLTRLWKLNVPAAGLHSMASGLGSDVPFFLMGGTALASGRGEVLTPLPDAAPAWLVLLVPSHSLAAKTAAMYRRLEPRHWSSGDRTVLLAKAISWGAPIGDALLGNSFESVADELFPELAAYREAMQQAGGVHHLSGSGPTIFSLFAVESEALVVAGRLRQQGYHPIVARTLTRRQAAMSHE